MVGVKGVNGNVTGRVGVHVNLALFICLMDGAAQAGFAAMEGSVSAAL